MIGRFLQRHAAGALLVGPDSESEQWVRSAAAAGDHEWAVCRKQRSGDRAVRIHLPAVPFHGRRVVLVDDVASTGRTLAATARAVLAAGATRVDVAVSHALFAGQAEATLVAAGVQSVWSTDSIAHSTNAIGVASLVAQALAVRR